MGIINLNSSVNIYMYIGYTHALLPMLIKMPLTTNIQKHGSLGSSRLIEPKLIRELKRDAPPLPSGKFSQGTCHSQVHTCAAEVKGMLSDVATELKLG